MSHTFLRPKSLQHHLRDKDYTYVDCYVSVEQADQRLSPPLCERAVVDSITQRNLANRPILNSG